MDDNLYEERELYPIGWFVVLQFAKFAVNCKISCNSATSTGALGQYRINIKPLHAIIVLVSRN